MCHTISTGVGHIISKTTGTFEINGVPQRDGGGGQGDSACAIFLLLEAAVADLAKTVEKLGLASAWIADRLGTRSTFISAIAIFTAASMLCGVSHCLYEFTAMRVLQGIGANC